MEYESCFDIIGPVMVGPSSSHTAGVVSIGLFVNQRLNNVPDRAVITLYDSFAQTYKGHGTDKAAVAGLLGFSTDDPRIREALDIAQKLGLDVRFMLKEKCPFYDHPNVLLIKAYLRGRSLEVGGVSLGGGISKIVLVDGQEADEILNFKRLEKDKEGG